MKRTALNLLVDFLAAACFVGMIATGFILRFPLPPGSNKSLSLWGLTRHQWGDVHFWISAALLVVLLTHLVLHWQWVVSVTAKQFGAAHDCQISLVKTGVATLIVLAAAAGGFAWWANISVTTRTEVCCPRRAPLAVNALPNEHPAASLGFGSDAYPILAARCFGCHGAETAQGGFRADRKESFFGDGRNPPWVIPGNAESSRLLMMLAAPNAASFHRLSEPEIGVLRAWINAGAEWPNP